MKNLYSCLLTMVSLLFSAGMFAQISIGGYNVYYGSLHNHSSVSDGQGTPSTAYNYAKNTSQLDFFSLADHSSAIVSTEWTDIKNAANTYNEDGVFVAFWGFEWSSSGAYGHVAVINTDDYCTTASPTNTFESLCTWLDSRECVAFFNHPGRENAAGTEFSHFSTTPSDKLVGMELWNKAVGFSTFYYNDGYYANDGNKGYYDEAIIRNWKIGASGSEDNHSGNWGNACNYRLAVLANTKTRTAIYAAFQARRFFSTLDKNIALSFKINGSEMGSTITAGNYIMQVQATDGDGEVFTTIKLVKNGAVINTWTPNSSNPNITQTLSCSEADYFYVIVTEADNNEAISSPVFIDGTPSTYCASQSTDFSSEYISQFILGTFIKSSSGSFYSDFTNPAIPLQPNKKYTVKITPRFIGGKKMEYFKVWIDYNNDFDFDDAGENVISGMKNAELKTSFTTPANVTGSKRMRVAMKRVAYPGSCETYNYGEVEDYTVNFGTKSSLIAENDKSLNPETYKGLMIYPNPATQNLFCEKMDDATYELEIYSILGQLVLKSEIADPFTTIDISKLKHGLYLIRSDGREGIKTSKLLVY